MDHGGGPVLPEAATMTKPETWPRLLLRGLEEAIRWKILPVQQLIVAEGVVSLARLGL